MKTLVAIATLLLAVASNASAQTKLPPDDCSWQSASGQAGSGQAGSGQAGSGQAGSEQPRGARPGSGPSRKALKLRTADAGKGYTRYNRDKPITVEQWFNFTCGLDALVPKEIPADKPIEGAETVRVKLRGYLLSARFMREGDHDIAVELAASPEWNSDHVVVEMSAGPEYCAARKALWDLVRKDGCVEDQCVLRKPVEVVVTGYVLIGNPQPGVTDYCRASTGRGMRRGDEQQGHVRGLWRLQPVLSVKKI